MKEGKVNSERRIFEVFGYKGKSAVQDLNDRW